MKKKAVTRSDQMVSRTIGKYVALVAATWLICCNEFYLIMRDIFTLHTVFTIGDLIVELLWIVLGIAGIWSLRLPWYKVVAAIVLLRLMWVGYTKFDLPFLMAEIVTLMLLIVIGIVGALVFRLRWYWVLATIAVSVIVFILAVGQ